MKKLQVPALAGALIVGCAALWELIPGVYTVNHIHALIFFKKATPLFWIIPPLAALAILYFCRKRIRLFEYIFRPLWLAGAVFLWPTYGTGMLCYALLIFVWCALRSGALMHRKFRKIPELPSSYSAVAAALLTIGSVCWSVFLQKSAFNALYLIYGDWGQYAECYMRLASGGASLKAWLCSAGHFNPLVNLILTGSFLISPSAETVFLVNALVTASAIPLIFILARSNSLSWNTSLLCAFLAAIFPIYTRQTLCLFYGFHPIIFFIPLLLGFFIARSRNNLWGMGICLVLSLLIQETVAVFWGGWGLYLFFAKKRYWQGILFSFAMVVWFAFLVLFVQPWAAEAQVYAQHFRYAALGHTPVEIALSPFTRPGAFWAAALSPRNALFASIILVPLFFGALSFPALLLTGVPILAGFFVQSSDDVKTPLLQYGVELGTLCFAVAIINLGRLKKGERPCFFRKKTRGNLYSGVLVSTLAGVVIAYIFFGFGYKFGLYPGDLYLHKPDASKVIAFLKKHLPERPARLLAPGRLRGHFMFDYPTESLTSAFQKGDWVLLDLHDPVFESPATLEPLRRKLYGDPRCRPVTHANWYGKQLVLLHIADSPDAPFPVKAPIIDEQLFNRAGGMVVPTRMKEIQGRYDGKMLHFRIKEELPADYDLFIRLTYPSGRVEKYEYSWYFGLFPAWAQKKGTLWSVPVKSGFVKCELLFKVRPESALSPSRAGQQSSRNQAAGN